MINTFTNFNIKDVKPMPMKFLPIDQSDFIVKNRSALIAYLKTAKLSTKHSLVLNKPYFNDCLSFSYRGKLQIGLGKNLTKHPQVIAMHNIEMLQGNLSTEQWATQILLKYRNWALVELARQKRMNAKEKVAFLNDAFAGTNALFTPYAYADWICSRLPTQRNIVIDIAYLEKTGEYFACKILPIVDYVNHLSNQRYQELINYLYSIATNNGFHVITLKLPDKTKIPSLATIVLINLICRKAIVDNPKLPDTEYIKLALLHQWSSNTAITLPHNAKYIASDMKDWLKKNGIVIQYI